MNNAIILIGAGGHARSCIDLIEQDGRFHVAGLVGTPDQIGSSVLGYPVLGSDTDLPRLQEQFKRAVISVGQVKSPDIRARLFAMARTHGCEFPVIVSPRAYVSPHATVGAGTVIMHGAVVNANARIGENCILNTSVIVDHDTQVEDHCHISTSAVLNGGVHVGWGSFVGSNTSVRQDIRIGARCVIGLGQSVLTNCPDGTWMPISKEAP